MAQRSIRTALAFFSAALPAAGAVRTIKIQGVPGVDTIPMNGGTSNLQAGEIFKIHGGQIHEIEAMGVSLPYGTKSGWE